MKKTYVLLFLISFLFLGRISAQGYLEVFGLRTWAVPQPQFSDKGWGGGMNILSPRMPVFGKDNVHPLDIQFGPGFYVSGFGMKRFSDVPLLPPLSGNAKVRLENMHMGVYGLLRFCSPNKNSGRMPYLDFMAGYRYMGSSMAIMPYKVPAGYSDQTDSSLKKVSSFMYGVGVGMQVKLSDQVNLDFELMWTYGPHTGDLVNLKSGQGNAGGISFDTERSPNSIMLLKVGFSFLCEDSRSSCSDQRHSSGSHYYYSGSHSSCGGGHSSSVHVSSGGGHVMAK